MTFGPGFASLCLGVALEHGLCLPIGLFGSSGAAVDEMAWAPRLLRRQGDRSSDCRILSFLLQERSLQLKQSYHFMHLQNKFDQPRVTT